MCAQTTARLLFCLIGMASSALAMARDGQPISASPRQVEAPFLTGGVGEDELAQLREQAAGFNVKVVFAEQGGAYISGVSVTIGVPGRPPLLQVVSGGPLLFVKLPPGSYEIKATHEGLTQARRFSVSNKARSEMTLRW